MLKALEILRKVENFKNTIGLGKYELKKAIKELEEIEKEDTYMLEKIEQSLHMGAKAQSLATFEVYQILKKKKQAYKNDTNI